MILWPPAGRHGSTVPPWVSSEYPEDVVMQVAEMRGNWGQPALTVVGVSPKEFLGVARRLNARVENAVFALAMVVHTASGPVVVTHEGVIRA